MLSSYIHGTASFMETVINCMFVIGEENFDEVEVNMCCMSKL
jgi:hypothetical protein